MSNKRKRYIPRKSETDYESFECEESEDFLPKTTYKIKREIVNTETMIDTGIRLGETFYNTTCEDLAKGLLGKILVRQLDHGSILKGIFCLCLNDISFYCCFFKLTWKYNYDVL